MVAKKDLLDLLKSKAIQVVELEKYVDGDLNYQFYRYYWVDKGVIRSNACCIVETSTGDAYFKDSIPSILVERGESFSNELAKSLESAGFTWFRIEEINERRKFAIVTIFSEDSSGVVSKRFFVWKDKEGKWGRKEIIT